MKTNKIVKETKEYIIVEKRSKRYGVKNTETKEWINGDEKIKILLKEKLIKAATPKPQPVEAEVEASTEEKADEAPAEEKTEEAAKEEAPAEEKKAE